MLIDSNYNLKIADFGFSIITNSRNKITNDKIGTLGYLAPEVYTQNELDAHKVDTFALGIVLFMMITGTIPFSVATTSDEHYSCIARNNADLFWKLH